MAIIAFLIWLCVIAIVIYIVIWAVSQIVPVPARVTQLLYVLGVLILLYYVIAYLPGSSHAAGTAMTASLKHIGEVIVGVIVAALLIYLVRGWTFG